MRTPLGSSRRHSGNCYLGRRELEQGNGHLIAKVDMNETVEAYHGVAHIVVPDSEAVIVYF